MDTDRKLRSHTQLENKKSFQKVDDDNRDSGTESDEENAELEEIEKQMEKALHQRTRTRNKNKKNLVSEGDSHLSSKQTYLSDSDQDLDKDTSDFERQNSDLERHSSEEELSVINGKELNKRTWSQMNRHSTSSSSSNGHNSNNNITNTPSANCTQVGGRSSGSTSDDEVKELLFRPQPLIFSSSPPKGILRIRNAPPGSERLFLTGVTSLAPIEVCAVPVSSSTPRKRHRLSSSDRKKKTVIQRPCLDFEKMQKALREEAAHCWKIEELICKRLKIED